MFKKVDPKSLIGIAFAVGAGIMAFLTEIDNQNKDKKIDDMEKRITNLEQKESE